MTAPSFISFTTTAINTATTPKTTASIAVQNGDILVASGISDAANNNTGAVSIAISTATGSTSAWTLQEDSSFTDNTHAYIRTWTASATATGNITVTFTGTNVNNLVYGGYVKVWRGSSGIGAVNKNNNGTGSGTPTISITTTGNNSGLDFSSVDWNAASGTVTFTASNGAPVSDDADQAGAGSTYCVYSSHVLDAGAAGAKTMGMSSPSGQRYVDTVIEVLGTAAAGGVSQHIYEINQSIQRASYW